MSTKCVLVFIPHWSDWGLVVNEWDPGKEIELKEISDVYTKSPIGQPIGQFEKEELVPLFKLTIEGEQISGSDVSRVVRNSNDDIKKALATWVNKLEQRIKKLEQRNKGKDEIEAFVGGVVLPKKTE